MLLTGCMSSGVTDVAAPEKLDLLALLEDTSEFQKALIEDGVVTEAELERALFARRDCVIATGAEPGEIYENANGEPAFDFEITARTEAEADTIQEAADACLREFYMDVGAVWAFGKLLTPAEREERRPEAITCFASAGLTQLTKDATVGDMISAIGADGVVSDAERACVEQFNGLFGTWENDSSEHDDE